VAIGVAREQLFSREIFNGGGGNDDLSRRGY